MRKKLFAFLSIILAAVLLVACKGEYEVAFDLDGGAPTIAAQTVEKGGLVEKPADPTKAGYDFVSWTLDGKDWNFSEDKVEKNITLKAKWDALLTVTFDLDGGAPAIDAQTLKKGSLVEKPADPTKDGYNFLGWLVDGEAWDFDEDKVDENITLKANWDALTVVTFDTAGGAPSIDPVVVEPGSKINKPARIPYREGYVFEGWGLNGVLFDFEEETIDASITLVALWEKMFEVAFDVRGGDKEIDPVLVEPGKKVPKPMEPTREGYNFVAWLLDGEEFDFDETIIEGDTLLVAQWAVKEFYTVTLIPDGGEPAPDMMQEVEKGHKLAKPAEMTRAGYEFLGWFNQVTDEEYDFNLPVEENLILVAKWLRVYEDFTVSFDINYEDGEEVESQTVTEEDTADEPIIDDREGYRFLGWFEEDAETPFDFAEMILSDVHLIAKWHLEHTVSFDLGYDELTLEDVKVLDGNNLTKPADPVREFYEFDGWLLDDELYNFEDPVEDDLVLVAKWTRLQTYSVEYENVDDSMFVYGTQEAMFDAYLTDFHEFLAPPASLSDFMHGPGQTEGYAGFWTEDVGNIYSGPRPEEGEYDDAYFASSHKYKDKWMPFHDMIDEWIIIVNPDQYFWGSSTWVGGIRLPQFIQSKLPGGQETAEDMLMMPDPLIQDLPIREHLGDAAIAIPTPYRVDADFEGWYDNAEFEGDAITEIPEGTKEDLVLYAKWAAIPEYDVSFDLGYDEGVNPDTQSVFRGSNARRPEDPEYRAGFRFVGWFIDLEGEEAFDFDSAITGPTVLLAKWREVVEHDVTLNFDTDGVEDEVYPIEEGIAFDRPEEDPVKEGYFFLGWYLEGAEEAYDFNDVIEAPITLEARWLLIEDYTVEYVLNDGYFLGEYADKDEMLIAFFTELYEFVDPAEDLDEFMHGEDKTEGYDGLWYSNEDYRAKIFVQGPRPTEANNNYFLTHEDSIERWVVLFDFIHHDFIKSNNDQQAFWDYGLSVGMLRFSQYVKGVKPASYWPDWMMTHVPAELSPVKSYKNVDGDIELVEPLKEGYFFLGWYDNAEFEGARIRLIAADKEEDITLYAKWGEEEASEFTVEFELGYDDLKLDDVVVIEDDKLEEPKAPTREGFAFLGWALEGEEDLFDFDTPIKDNMVLVAQWEELDKHTVTFDHGDYEDAPEDIVKEVIEGNLVEKPEDPVREGHVFEGWFLDLEDEEAFDFNEPITDDVVLVAKWRAADLVSVTFDLNYEDAPDAEVVKVEAGNAVDAPEAPAREDYIFLGWFIPEATDAYDFSEIVDEDLTLEARWLLIETFTITYELDDGAFPEGGYETNEEMIVAFLTDFHAYLTANHGYDKDLDTFMHGEGKTEGYDGEYTVDHLFAANDKSVDASKDKFINQPEYNPKWLPVMDLMEEYTQVGNQSFWGSPYTAGLRFKPFIQKRSLWGGEEEVVAEITNRIPEELQAVIVPVEYKTTDEAILLPVPSKDDVDFLGWYLNADFEGEAITEIAADQTGDLTLYAKWGTLVVNEYTVEFNLNYDGSVNPDNQIVEEGALVVEPEVDAREGYKFLGWYVGDDLYDFDAAVTGNLALVAKWELLPVAVVYDLGDYGYVSDLDKDDIFLAFVTDYKELYGRTETSIEDLLSDFAAKSYIPGDIKDIFQEDYEDGKWAWLHDYLIDLATEVDYAEIDGLTGYNQTTWRTNIEAFFNDKQFNYAGASESLDFANFDAANGFWVYSPYNKVSFVFADVDGLLDAELVKSWNPDYVFAGFEDADGVLVTELPEEVTEDLALFARWEEVLVEYDHVETFDDLALEGSTYAAGDFVGVDGQEWLYNDARGDLELDGAALLLRNGSLKTTLFSGLSKISFEYDRAFTGTGARKFEVIVNGVVIDTIIVNPEADERKVYVSADLEYAGLVHLEIRGTGAQKLIDNVSWNEYDDGKEYVIVTFDLGDGETMLSQTLKGEAIAKPVDPEKTGYDFDGWYLDEVEFDFDTLVDEAITLVAKWVDEVITGPQTVTAKYEGATTNMADGNNAATIGLNEDIFTVTSEKGQQGNHVGLNGAGQIRLYAHRGSGDGATLIIEVEEGFVITDVKIVFGASTNDAVGELILGEGSPIALESADVLDTFYEANDLTISKFSLQNTQTEADNSKNGQIYILSIEITFEPVED